ncbi:MAG TPA: hypothetical protein VGN88_10675 [Phycisphaerae bacterium]
MSKRIPPEDICVWQMIMITLIRHDGPVISEKNQQGAAHKKQAGAFLQKRRPFPPYPYFAHSP